MRKGLLVICIIALGITACHKPKEVSLVVLQTTDLHGHLGTEMSALSGYIKTMRHLYDDRLILLDGGDNLQGTPQVFLPILLIRPLSTFTAAFLIGSHTMSSHPEIMTWKQVERFLIRYINK